VSTIKSVVGPGGAGGSIPAGVGGTYASKGAADTSKPGGEVSVQLSDRAAQLQAMDTGMANTPVVDAAHVAAIKQAIADGLFKVNPDVVADHLLATARELLQSRRPG
jgi:negative regulator of flagellin synthesis FlgM